MDYYDRLGYGKEGARAPARKPPADHQYYLGREHEHPYGPRIEGRDLLSGGRERQSDPYGPPHMERHDLLPLGRERDLEFYKNPKVEGQDLLSSIRERELESHRPRMEGRDILSLGREGGLDSYRRTHLEGRDLLASGKDLELDQYRPLRTEERDSYRPYLEGRYSDRDREHEVHARWREQDSLVGGRDLARDKLINGLGGMHATDYERMDLGIGSSRIRSSAIDDPALMVRGSQFGKGLDSMQGPLDHDGIGRDNEPIHGVAESPSEPVLFVDGLPLDCTRREAAHIFRPFVGFKEVRIVHKEPKRGRGEKIVLCFVEFTELRLAATALESLQGYKLDEHNPHSPSLRISFSLYSSRSKGSAYREDSRGGLDSERGYWRNHSGWH